MEQSSRNRSQRFASGLAAKTARIEHEMSEDAARGGDPYPDGLDPGQNDCHDPTPRSRDETMPHHLRRITLRDWASNVTPEELRRLGMIR